MSNITDRLAAMGIEGEAVREYEMEKLSRGITTMRADDAGTMTGKADAAIESLLGEVERRDGRRCDECDSREGSSHYCLLWSINTHDEHYCRDFEARAERREG